LIDALNEKNRLLEKQ
jgi:hypothetical protein